MKKVWFFMVLLTLAGAPGISAHAIQCEIGTDSSIMTGSEWDPLNVTFSLDPDLSLSSFNLLSGVTQSFHFATVSFSGSDTISSDVTLDIAAAIDFDLPDDLGPVEVNGSGVAISGNVDDITDGYWTIEDYVCTESYQCGSEFCGSTSYPCNYKCDQTCHGIKINGICIGYQTENNCYYRATCSNPKYCPKFCEQETTCQRAVLISTDDHENHNDLAVEDLIIDFSPTGVLLDDGGILMIDIDDFAFTDWADIALDAHVTYYTCSDVYNPDHSDNDGDNMSDICDPDDDNDGVKDGDDNCPFTANPNQEDSDNDTIGDVCDEHTIACGNGVREDGEECEDNMPCDEGGFSCIECACVEEKPSAITLTSFKAQPGNRTVKLIWQTADEENNMGFNIYRAESEDGTYSRINAALIPTQGLFARGATYRFVDDGLRNRTAYYYKLEDLDNHGDSTLHGPVQATPRSILGHR